MVAHLRQVFDMQLAQLQTLQADNLHEGLKLTVLLHFGHMEGALQLSSQTTALTSVIRQDTSADCSLLIEGHQHAHYVYELSQTQMILVCKYMDIQHISI
jgi:hypothetical protein